MKKRQFWALGDVCLPLPRFTLFLKKHNVQFHTSTKFI